MWKLGALDFDETLSEALATYEMHFVCSGDWNLVHRFFNHQDYGIIISQNRNYGDNVCGVVHLLIFGDEYWNWLGVTIEVICFALGNNKSSRSLSWQIDFVTKIIIFKVFRISEICEGEREEVVIQNALAGVLLDTSQLAKHDYATLMILK